ncbi:hypothetical protein ABBQ38_010295 [Trebouxia sp. C0009 RCD-2024]
MASPQVKPLQEICLQTVAANFAVSPSLAYLPEAHLSKLISLLSLELPLELAGTVIDSEEYWKRRAISTWSNCQASGYCQSWKQLYFQRYVEAQLEKFDPATSDFNELKRLLTFSSKFVNSLHLQQLPSHLDLQIVFEAMRSGIAHFSLTYGLRNTGMNYDRAMFGMKLPDCRSLAKTLEKSETLVTLGLPSNLLEDDKIRMIASGLVDNHSVTSLDLSHNKIADRGVRALVKVLDSSNVVTFLDLHDNQIHVEGGQALARAMRANHSLVSLNLRLNRLGDVGCSAICSALSDNTILERLSLSANGAGPQTAEALSTVLRSNATLREVDLSANSLGVAAGRMLREAVAENMALERLDVRLSGVAEDEENAIADILQNRLLEQAQQK